MKLIALDIANTTGFATPDCSGSIRLTAKTDKYSYFRHFLWELYSAYEFDTIAVERVAGMHKEAIISMAKLHGIVEKFAEEKGVEVVSFSAKSIKKFFTGNGNAGKNAMIEEFKKRFNEPPVDDNEADARALYLLAEKELA